MELNHQAIETPVRDASTVVLLRDAPAGLEVFLMKRSGLSDVLGGAYVFPGGKRDDADTLEDLPNRLTESLGDLSSSLNESVLNPIAGATLYVTAIREAFEESGVLFAENASPDVIAKAYALIKEGVGFDDILSQLGLRLQTKALQPWSRWITPKLASVSSKRFDTRFFIATVPENQTAEHDNYETTTSVWLTPRAALEEYWSGSIALAPPQIMSLAHLSHHHTVASALAEARSKPPAVIEPEPFDYDGIRTITYPGDPQHSVRQRALPGPTRLRYANKRFEPIDGFEALFLKT
jgi:8-oxo-dGTP pyrophosphatase MutT (NUDIX family)